MTGLYSCGMDVLRRGLYQFFVGILANTLHFLVLVARRERYKGKHGKDCVLINMSHIYLVCLSG